MNRVEQPSAAVSRARTLVAAVVIVLCGWTAYSNSFTDLFAGLDGKESIRDNLHIRHVWPLSEAISLPMWTIPLDSDGPSTISFRPSMSLSLALTNRFLGTEPPAHHAVSLAIHIAAALALFGILGCTLRRQRYRPISDARSTYLALAAALIWLLHPLQTESVTYLAQRCASLMGLLLLLTLYCSIRAAEGRRRLWWSGAAVAACLVGTGAKETAALGPLLVLIYDYTFVSGSTTRWSRPAFYAALAAPAWLLILPRLGKISAHTDPSRYFAYLLAQPGAIVHYLRLSVWPDELYLYVNSPVFEVQSIARAVIPTAILVALFVATVRYVARRHWLGFVGAWFFITLGPTSSIIAMPDQAQEHRMYVPLAALTILAVLGGEWALGRATQRFSARKRWAVEAALLTVVLLGLGIRTYVRNWDYHHEFAMLHPADVHEDYTILADHYLSREGLIQEEARRARAMLDSSDKDERDVVFSHFVLGLADADAGRVREAFGELGRVLELDPDFGYGHHHLGIVLRDMNDLPAAIEQFREAIRLEPALLHAYKELAVTLAMTGDEAGADEQLRLALAIQPRFAESMFESGMSALRRGDRQTARESFRDALHNRPDLIEPRYELAMLALGDGDENEALEHLAAAVELRPELVEVRKAMGMVLARLERRPEARRQFERAIELRPDYAEAHGELAIVLRQEGELDAAAKHLARALELKPESADFHYQLGRLLIDQGDRARAREEYRAALSLDPDHFTANYDLAHALVADGDRAAAIPYLERAIERCPDDAAAHRRIEELRQRIQRDAALTEEGGG